MAIVASWSGDGLTAGAMTTASTGAGDTVISEVTSTVSLVDTGPRIPQIEFTNPSGGAECVVVWEFTAQALGTGRFYFTTPSALPASGQIPYFFEIYSGTSRLASMDITSTGRFNLRSNTAVLQQGPSGMVQPSTRYRIEWMLDNSTNQIVAHIFVGDSETVLQTLSGTATAGATHSRVRLGRMNGANVNPYQVDDLVVTNTGSFVGPWAPPASAARHFRWSGTAWIAVEPRRL